MIYLIVFLLLLLIGSKRFTINKTSLYYYGVKYRAIIFFSLALFLCGGYMTGSDWRYYELLYYEINWNNINFYPDEKLFYLFMLLTKYFVNDFFVFLILVKLVVFYIYYSFFKTYSSNIFYSYFLFGPLFALFLFVDNPLRYMMALGFVVISYRFIINQHLLKFTLILLIGTFFHYTVILFFPFYFIAKIRLPNKILIPGFIAWFFLFTSNNLLSVITLFNNYIPEVLVLYQFYIRDAMEIQQSYSLGLLINILFFFLLVANRDKICGYNKNGDLFFFLSVIYLFSAKLSVIFPAGFRISYLFAPFFVVSLTYLFQLYSKRLLRVVPIIISAYIIIFTFKKVNNHYVYFPYTNYFVHVLTDDLHSYYYRSNYNIERFYEKNRGYLND